MENCCVPNRDGTFKCTAYAPISGNHCRVCKYYESWYLMYFGECKHLWRTNAGSLTRCECTNEWARIGEAMEEI